MQGFEHDHGKPKRALTKGVNVWHSTLAELGQHTAHQQVVPHVWFKQGVCAVCS